MQIRHVVCVRCHTAVLLSAYSSPHIVCLCDAGVEDVSDTSEGMLSTAAGAARHVLQTTAGDTADNL